MLAHELSHVRNRDVLIATIAAGVAGLISTLGHVLQWGLMFGGGSRTDDERGSGLAALAWIIVAPIIALLIQLAISRSRELGADSAGAALSGDPDALADALVTLEQSKTVRPYEFAGPGDVAPVHREPAARGRGGGAHGAVLDSPADRGTGTPFARNEPAAGSRAKDRTRADEQSEKNPSAAAESWNR